MTFSMNREDAKLTVAVAGSLDTLTSPKLAKELEPALVGVSELVMDLKDLEYTSSAGLRVLMGAAQVMAKQGEMTVTNVQDEVMKIFKLTHFTDIFRIVLKTVQRGFCRCILPSPHPQKRESEYASSRQE